MLTFKSKSKETGDGLPHDLQTVIEHVHVVLRSSDEDGIRAVVQIDGSGWIHSPLETRAQIRRRYPDLTESQLDRAARFIGARVRQASVQTEPRRKNWATNWGY